MNRANVIFEIEEDFKKANKEILDANYKKAKKILKQAYYKSLDINYTLGAYSYFEKIIQILHYKRQFIPAISLIKNLLKTYVRINNKEGQSFLYNILGVILSILSDFNGSSYYLKKSLEISINLKPINHKRITSVYLGLSFNYSNQNINDKALVYQNLGLQYFETEEAKKSNFITYFYLMLEKITLNIKDGKIKLAKQLFETLDKKNINLGANEMLEIESLKLNFIVNEKEFDSINFISRCIKLIEKAKDIHNDRWPIEVFEYMEKYYIHYKNIEKALECNNEILKIYEKQPTQTSILQIKEFNSINSIKDFNEDFVVFQEEDLLLASKYQTNFFKNKFNSSKLNIDTYFKSSKNLSSDYLGTFHLDGDDNHYLFILADVVSEGLSSTYISFMLDGIIKSIIYNSSTYNLKKIVKDINNILSSSLKNQGFVSLWAGIVDINKKTIESVNAGAIPAYILTKENEIKKLNIGCTILGMFEELPNIESEILSFNEDCSLLAISEGIKKTIMSSENDFNLVINNMIHKYSKNKSKKFVDLLLKNVNKYQDYCHIDDDISCLVVEYKDICD